MPVGDGVSSAVVAVRMMPMSPTTAKIAVLTELVRSNPTVSSKFLSSKLQRIPLAASEFWLDQTPWPVT